MDDTKTLELVLPASTYLALKQAAEQKKKTEVELILEAIQKYLVQLTQIEPLLGLFANEPELMDEVAADAMRGREGTPIGESKGLGMP